MRRTFGQLSSNLNTRFVSALAFVSLTLASWWFSYQKRAQIQLSVWDWTPWKAQPGGRHPPSPVCYWGLWTWEWVDKLFRCTHVAAVSSSMLEFAWMLALFILGMPSCLFLAVFCSLKPTPLGPQYRCCSPLHLGFYQLMLLIWCDRTLAKGLFSGFKCSKH